MLDPDGGGFKVIKSKEQEIAKQLISSVIIGSLVNSGLGILSAIGAFKSLNADLNNGIKLKKEEN